MARTLIVESLIKGALREVVGSAIAPPPAQAVKEAAEVIVNQTNNEPWWQSRVTWGALAAILGGLGTMAGLVSSRDFSPGLWFTSLSSVGGGFGTLYGRWVARKPLGV